MRVSFTHKTQALRTPDIFFNILNIKQMKITTKQSFVSALKQCPNLSRMVQQRAMYDTYNHCVLSAFFDTSYSVEVMRRRKHQKDAFMELVSIYKLLGYITDEPISPRKLNKLFSTNGVQQYFREQLCDILLNLK